MAVPESAHRANMLKKTIPGTSLKASPQNPW